MKYGCVTTTTMTTTMASCRTLSRAFSSVKTNNEVYQIACDSSGDEPANGGQPATCRNPRLESCAIRYGPSRNQPALHKNVAREKSKAKSLLRRSTMATLGAVLSALIKNKKKLALMQRYFEHFEFADYNTIASVLRWIRDNPCDLTDRPSSPRVLWSNKRMHEALKILGEVLSSDAVRAVVETNKPVSQSEYDDIVACVNARCTEFGKDIMMSSAATSDDDCDDCDDCDEPFAIAFS